MLEQIIGLFLSFFSTPSLLGIGLAIVFGAVWLAAYWPPLFRDAWLWAIMVASAFLTLGALAFVQAPLQTWTQQVLLRLLNLEAHLNWWLLAGIPAVLLSGLVQEGAKMVPAVVYWWRRDKNISPRLGLMVGAVAGAGFGMFEAQWAHNAILASGWSWDAVSAYGFLGLAGFWERFFSVAFHIAASALAGYGLAKGWGWQFYLLASLLHTVLNYGVIPVQIGLLSVTQVEIFIAIFATLVTAGALWLRWQKSPVTAKI
jgi:RsiW-degrading membrane proteinase PrsW (M82 family)